MKKVKRVRKSGENIERSESQFYFALAVTQFISENVRLCRIACYMYMRSEQNRQRPKKGVADVRGYNGADRKFSPFQHSQDKILAVT